jgi:hypothetical protein
MSSQETEYDIHTCYTFSEALQYILMGYEYAYSTKDASEVSCIVFRRKKIKDKYDVYKPKEQSY